MYVLLYPFRLLLAFILVFFQRVPVEQDVINYIMNTLLIMYVRRGDLAKYRFVISKCHLDVWRPNMAPFPLRSFSIDFDDHRVVKFMLNGKPETDPSVWFSVITSYHILSAHAKTHMLGKSFMKRIQIEDPAKSRHVLPEVTSHTDALHHSLLNSPYSPAKAENGYNLFYTAATRESFVPELYNWEDLTHEGISVCADKPFMRYLIRARGALLRQLRDIDLGHLVDPMFSHTILHAIDHVQTARWSEGLQVALGPYAGGWIAWAHYRMFVGLRLCIR